MSHDARKERVNCILQQCPDTLSLYTWLWGFGYTLLKTNPVKVLDRVEGIEITL